MALSWSDSSFYTDVRYVHQSAGNAQGISECPRVSFFYGDSNTHFDFILTKMSKGQSFLTIIQVNLLAFRNSRDNILDLSLRS